ncbi:MAG: hypothetical protein AAF915_16775 [Cyanobacteria bacterium P01_D01_bin.50]
MNNFKRNIEFLRETIELVKSPEEMFQVRLAIHKLYLEVSEILTKYNQLSKDKEA